MSAPLPCWSSTRTMIAERATNTCKHQYTSVSQPYPLHVIVRCAGRAPDRHEILRHQRRPADQTAVDVRHREQLRRVRRLHAASVEDRKPRRRRLVLLRASAPADERMRLLRLVRRRRLAGADRPHRLVGDTALRQAATPAAASTASSWRATTASVAPASRSSSVSPTQKIGVSPARRAAAYFAATSSSRLAEELPPLRMPHDHVAAAELRAPSRRKPPRCRRPCRAGSRPARPRRSACRASTAAPGADTGRERTPRISTPGTLSAPALTHSRRSSFAARLPFIFQLPATSLLRIGRPATKTRDSSRSRRFRSMKTAG